ncbi:MarR family winged helix-turn-helix transcriptional regulator [Sedimentibacter saalensis]|uniref:HTH-type transcriptional regulator SarZ n=1 Tax=Sedimentibacter saalensis TaxID=130788 RepID=A0A562JH79_9FIRM|nr:MarR family transcriptional regulator [Sedimentibacter saalensis]TWH82587.1 DNA-binding MarR family transcriptional regulator [Sedimentibacter saalensis]
MDNNINNDNYEMLKLDNQLCFSLYVCSKEIIKKYKPLLDPLGLTYTSYITLLALWEEDNINVKDLGKKLYLDSGTLTPILKKLESQNFITRTRSAEDERSVNISLTKEGISLKEKAKNVYSELACSLFNNSDELSSGMELLNSLHKLMNSFNQNSV